MWHWQFELGRWVELETLTWLISHIQSLGKNSRKAVLGSLCWPGHPVMVSPWGEHSSLGYTDILHGDSGLQEWVFQEMRTKLPWKSHGVMSALFYWYKQSWEHWSWDLGPSPWWTMSKIWATLVNDKTRIQWLNPRDIATFHGTLQEDNLFSGMLTCRQSLSNKLTFISYHAS